MELAKGPRPRSPSRRAKESPLRSRDVPGRGREDGDGVLSDEADAAKVRGRLKLSARVRDVGAPSR